MKANADANGMIALVGATGALGGAICQLLVDRGATVRALVRSSVTSERPSVFSSSRVQVLQGDLRNEQDLRKLCAGARYVVSTASALTSRRPGDTIQNVDQEGHFHLVDAAESAGVEQFVFVSIVPQTERVTSPLEQAKRRVEQRLQASSMNSTILRPSYFAEIWLSQTFWPVLGFDLVRREARIAGNGQNQVNWISLADVAQYAVSTLGNVKSYNKSLDLGGPEALSPLQIVDLLRRASGKGFSVKYITDEELLTMHSRSTGAFDQAFAALLISCSKGSVIDCEEAQNVIPFELRSVTTYISRIMKHL